ncbi:MAG: DUF3168 domain-containing protein [Devosia nanyangense]|uniref:DUF3168 domain-containing protein n=1 Tax=Devosia nanyangense TaxID=1228055 RepID=A0A933L6I7_9HYPH|nr:DUF3168 domain-containing protein [Devosia nanyangense]
MTHPILALQGTLVAALRGDTELAALAPVFDAPPNGREPPYVVIARHDVLPRDGDGTPGHEHRVLFHAWATDASRKAVLAIAERVVAVALGADLDSVSLIVPLRRHDRTDTAIDGGTGRARAAVAMTFFTEPTG